MEDKIKKNDTMAIISIILGVCGITFVFLPKVYLIAIVPSILAVVLGKKAKNKINNSDGDLKGLGIAKAGCILGIIGIVLAILVLLLLGVLFSMLLK